MCVKWLRGPVDRAEVSVAYVWCMSSAVDLLFPELTETIEEWWRGTHDDGVPPHITLLHPWVDVVTDGDVEKVRHIASTTSPFDIAFASVESFAAGAVYLCPVPEAPIRNLMRSLARAFPDSPLYGGAIADPVPHLTIMRTEPGQETEEMREAIAESLSSQLPLTTTVSTIAVMERRPNGAWHIRTSVPLLGHGDSVSSSHRER